MTTYTNIRGLALAAILGACVSTGLAQSAVSETKTVTPAGTASETKTVTPSGTAVTDTTTTAAPVAPVVVDQSSTTTTTTTNAAPTHEEKERAKKELKHEYKEQKEAIEHPDR